MGKTKVRIQLLQSLEPLLSHVLSLLSWKCSLTPPVPPLQALSGASPQPSPCPSSSPGSGLVLSLNPSGDQMPLRISRSTRLQPQLHPDMCSKAPALYFHCHKLYSFTFQSMSLNSSSWEEGKAYGKACSLTVLKTQHQCWHSGVCTVRSCPDYCKSWSIWSSSHRPKLHQSKP